MVMIGALVRVVRLPGRIGHLVTSEEASLGVMSRDVVS
jgi:hypothetical protein